MSVYGRLREKERKEGEGLTVMKERSHLNEGSMDHRTLTFVVNLLKTRPNPVKEFWKRMSEEARK